MDKAEATLKRRSLSRRVLTATFSPIPFGVAAIALGIDQLTKYFITANLALYESWPSEGFARFTYVTNSGSFLGLFREYSSIITWVAIAVTSILFLLYTTISGRHWILRIALGLMLGGALGNVVDRLRLGSVVDFIDIGPWPIFNAADSFVTTGAVTFMLFLVFFERKASQNIKPSDGTAEDNLPQYAYATEESTSLYAPSVSAEPIEDSAGEDFFHNIAEDKLPKYPPSEPSDEESISRSVPSISAEPIDGIGENPEP